jgi:peptidoglycan/LPS O-acetylase OafA/YrhL
MVTIFHFRFENFTQLIQNVFLVQTLFPGYISYPGGWSISYEWLFSLLIGTGLLTFSKNIRILVILFSVSVQIYLLLESGVLLNSASTEKWFGPLLILIANVSFFVFGISLRKHDFSINRKLSGFVLVISSVLILLTLTSLYSLSLWFLFVCSLSSFVLNSRDFVEARLGKSLKILVHKLGKYTYGLFCGHFIVMISLNNLIIGEFVFVDWLLAHLGVLGYLINFGLVFTLAYIFASFSYRYLEKPSMNFARHILK